MEEVKSNEENYSRLVASKLTVENLEAARESLEEAETLLQEAWNGTFYHLSSLRERIDKAN
ncbi:hypothetical protein [Cytobacillus sp. IB215665]|uniref:hypothetical protein n=1 Tax=Cytobacillus sp. IB215665 TaxID=3097357 RepID=UPI002A14220E|nr:hypothetical protein [Cytobacillus sp. IB215665]MDX8367216.1 hypothetical protein [Cytobacillus sp. IB215665]